MTPNERQIVADIQAKVAFLSSEGKAAVAKAAQFGARFQWFYVAVASVAAFLFAFWLRAHI